MSNKMYEIFNPNSDYNKSIMNKINQIHQEFIDNRSCFVCESVIDISDDRNTCHLCEWTHDLIPREHTCLLWKLKEDKNES